MAPPLGWCVPLVCSAAAAGAPSKVCRGRARAGAGVSFRVAFALVAWAATLAIGSARLADGAAYRAGDKARTCKQPGAPQGGEPDEHRSLLVGESATTIGAYPFAVAIGETPSDAGNVRAYCGGALISPGMVLTAAHCAYRVNANGEPLDTLSPLPRACAAAACRRRTRARAPAWRRLSRRRP